MYFGVIYYSCAHVCVCLPACVYESVCVRVFTLWSAFYMSGGVFFDHDSIMLFVKSHI